MKRRDLKLARLEGLAMFRQLRDSFPPSLWKTFASCALAVLLGFAIGYLRASVRNLEHYFIFNLLLCFISGVFLFPANNIDYLLQQEKFQNAVLLPVNTAFLYFLKLKKVLLFRTCLFAALTVHIFVGCVLGGTTLAFSAGNALCMLLSFAFAQNIRLILFVFQKDQKSEGSLLRILTGILLPLLALCVILLQRGTDAAVFARALEFAGQTYAGNCWSFFAGLLLLTFAENFVILKTPLLQKREVSRRVRALPKQLYRIIRKQSNFIFQKDLLQMLRAAHSGNNLAVCILTALLWTLLAFLGGRFLQDFFDQKTILFYLVIIFASSVPAPFLKNLEIGYEGNYLYTYILSGKEIGKLQLLRVRYILLLSLPMYALPIIFLGALFNETGGFVILMLFVLMLSSAFFAVNTAFYRTKRTSYFNEVNIPNLRQLLLQQMIESAYESLCLIPVALIHILTESFLQKSIVFLYYTLLFAVVTIYTGLLCRKLAKNSRDFYGEFNDAV